ncbi:MAG: glycosyltransferase [Kiritimatiellia bacterium]
MRVLHVIDSLDPRNGGLPRAAACLAAAQAAAGATAGILYHEPDGGPQPARGRFDGLEGFGAVELLPLPRPGLREHLSGARAAGAMEGFAPDLLHLHGVWEPLLPHAARWAGRTGRPHVLLTHSMLDPWHQARHRALKWVLMNLLGWNRMFTRALFVQALTPFEGRYISALHPAARIEVVSNGIFASEMPDVVPAAEEVFPFLAGRPYVLSAARLHPQKGPEVLLEAFRRIAARRPDLCLVLAGPDFGSAAALRAGAAAAGLDGRVFLPGQLARRELQAALAGAAVFCLPSRAEGFSLALLAAALAGAPLVITPECHFDELVAEGAARSVPLDPDELARTLLDVAADPDARRVMGGRARHLVRTRYTWAAVATRLLTLYAAKETSP